MAEVVDEYEFVEPLPTSYKCPVCRQVQKEAQETDCCFTYFCRQCIEGVINDGKPCPKCDSKKFTASPDTWQQQWIGELKVRCPNRKWGCDRTMELRGVEQHLRECEYTLAECDRGCGQRVRHTSIEQHRETCPKRPSVCEYCKQYKSAHDDVESNHKPKCNYRPIVCPNQCDESRRFPACELNKHLNQCPEQEIECTFTSVGCTAHVKRKNMQRHLAEHLQTASAGFQKLTEKMDDIQRKKQMQALQRSQAESPQGSGDIVTSRMQSDSIAKLQEQVRHMKWKYEYLTEREGTLPQDLSQEVGGSQPPTIPGRGYSACNCGCHGCNWYSLPLVYAVV